MRSLARVVALVAVVLAVATVAQAQDVTLSVAISMKEAVEELGKGFMASRPGVTLRYNFGSSGELQKQIEAGAPVDLFISAAQRQMDELEQKRLVVERHAAASSRATCSPSSSRRTRRSTSPSRPICSTPRVTKIVIGNPKTVPAGQYSEESLKALGMWEKVQPKLVFAENVRQALDYVARGEVDAGFVYTTDAATRGQQVKEAFRPAEDTYRPVLYPVAVVAGAKQAALAQAFLDLLLSREGQATLGRLGFQPPPTGIR